jgi:pyruvate formate lyase activating enzyme
MASTPSRKPRRQRPAALPGISRLASHRYDLQSHSLETDAAAALDPALRRTHSGYIHSVETAGTLDGPGIRSVIFLSGCHFRCLYCHNPDTWSLRHGIRVTVDDLMELIERYADFLIRYRGGVTLSGGEVLVQYAFVASLVRRLKQRGLHVALDTNGFAGARVGRQLLDDVDLWLLDLKCFDNERHRALTGRPNGPVLQFARRLAREGARVWARFVLVPGVTDDFEDIENLADFLVELGNVERVEVLRFHQMGAYKWNELGLDYTLADTGAPDEALVDRVCHQFAGRGLRVG